MKRIILRLTLAAVTFAFGVAVDRVVISRGRSSPPAKNVEPVIATTSVTVEESGWDTSEHIVLSPPDAPRPIVLFDFNPAKFDPDGSYFPLQPLPKEFRDIQWFDLAFDRDEGEVWSGAYIQTTNNDGTAFPHAEFLLVTERRVFFVTSAREDNGFAYRFEGVFLANPASQIDKGKATVRGTLSKTKNGRTVAKCEASFEVEYLGC